jgi:hypothetical protein
MSAATGSSAWAPLRQPAFRWLWVGVLLSSVGTMMQTVGAQWLLVDAPNAAALVSLVQAANTLPVMLLALAGGVLADSFDRCWLLFRSLPTWAASRSSSPSMRSLWCSSPSLCSSGAGRRPKRRVPGSASCRPCAPVAATSGTSRWCAASRPGLEVGCQTVMPWTSFLTRLGT